MYLASLECYTRVPYMVLLMSRPFKHPKTGIFWLRKRVPKDLVSIVGTEWEANTLAEVLALPRVTVTRPLEEQFLAAGMLPYDCHANCFAQAANDPDRVSRHVCGWLIYGSDLILHSAVETRGHWLCLMPQLVQAPSQFQFIPDSFIEWLDTGDGGRHAFRGGVRLPKALRKYPTYHLRMWDELHDLVALGMSAFDAREMVDVTLGAELRKMEPI